MGQSFSALTLDQYGGEQSVQRSKTQNHPEINNPTDYKFSRVPGLTYACAVRANAFGAFAAVKMNDDVLKEQIEVSPSSLWQDIFPLLSFGRMQRRAVQERNEPTAEEEAPCPGTVRRAVLTSEDIESELASFFERHGPFANLGL